MIYDDYNKETKNDDYDTGYKNVGSSGTNSANKYEEAHTGQDNGYSRTEPGSYREPRGNAGNYSGQYGGTSNGYYGNSYSNPQGRTHYTSYQDSGYRAPGYNPGNQGNAKPGAAKGKKSFWKKAIAAILIGVLLGGSAAGAFYGVYKLSDLDEAVETLAKAGAEGERPRQLTTTTSAAKQEDSEEVREAIATTNSNTDSSVSQVVEEVMPSIVAITNSVTMRGQTWWGQPIERTGEAAGSGIIVGENDDELLIVTNQHVISDATSLSVQFVDGNAAEANIKGQDEEADIAVIAVAKNSLSGNTADEIRIATLGDSDDLQVGEQVVAIGNAMGYGQSTTTGIISALGREAELENGNHELIQTDAAINPGNSGGALLNMRGELIGINEAKAGQVLSNGTIVEGMGYAIPISKVQPIIDDLMNKETKVKAADDNQSYLGIGGVDVTEDVSSTYDIPEGIYVAQVEAGSAAENAGLVRGDVIIKFDGQSVGSMKDLKDLMQYYEAGQTVDITVKKQSEGGYNEETISVKLGKRPSEHSN